MSHLLDVRGLQCPLPVLRTRKKLLEVAPGEILTVLATDPASRIDMRAFCNEAELELIGASEAAGVFRYEIRQRA